MSIDGVEFVFGVGGIDKKILHHESKKMEILH